MFSDRRSQEPFDIVNRAKHYNSHPSGVEVIEVTERLPNNLGNAFKYVVRREGKEELRSLKSAVWYLERHRRFPAFAPHLSQDSLSVVMNLLQKYEAAETDEHAQAFFCLLGVHLESRLLSQGDQAEERRADSLLGGAILAVLALIQKCEAKLQSIA